MRVVSFAAFAAVAAFAASGMTGCAASSVSSSAAVSASLGVPASFGVPSALAAPATFATFRPVLAEVAPASGDSAAAPAGGAPRPAHEESMEDRTARQMNRALGWVLLSVGAEGAAVATVTSFMMLHQGGVRSDDCVGKVCSAEGLAANTTLHNLEWWNAGAWVVAVAGVGAGAVLLWTNPSDKALHTQVGIAPTGSGSSLLLRGAF
jgi:hypothetical protein